MMWVATSILLTVVLQEVVAIVPTVKRVHGKVIAFGYTPPPGYAPVTTTELPHSFSFGLDSKGFYYYFTKACKPGFGCKLAATLVYNGNDPASIKYSEGVVVPPMFTGEDSVDTFEIVDATSDAVGYSIDPIKILNSADGLAQTIKVAVYMVDTTCKVRTYVLHRGYKRSYMNVDTVDCEEDGDYRDNPWVRQLWQQENQAQAKLGPSKSTYAPEYPQKSQPATKASPYADKPGYRPVAINALKDGYEGEVEYFDYHVPSGDYRPSNYAPSRNYHKSQFTFTYKFNEHCLYVDEVKTACIYVVTLTCLDVYMDTFKVKSATLSDHVVDSIQLVETELKTDDTWTHKVIVRMVNKGCKVRLYERIPPMNGKAARYRSYTERDCQPAEWFPSQEHKPYVPEPAKKGLLALPVGGQTKPPPPPPAPLSAPGMKHDVLIVTGEVDDYEYKVPNDYMLTSTKPQPSSPSDRHKFTLYTYCKRPGAPRLRGEDECVCVVQLTYDGLEVQLYKVSCEGEDTTLEDILGSIHVAAQVRTTVGTHIHVIVRTWITHCMVQRYLVKVTMVVNEGTKPCDEDPFYVTTEWAKKKYCEEHQLPYEEPGPKVNQAPALPPPHLKPLPGKTVQPPYSSGPTPPMSAAPVPSKPKLYPSPVESPPAYRYPTSTPFLPQPVSKPEPPPPVKAPPPPLSAPPPSLIAPPPPLRTPPPPVKASPPQAPIKSNPIPPPPVEASYPPPPNRSPTYTPVSYPTPPKPKPPPPVQPFLPPPPPEPVRTSAPPLAQKPLPPPQAPPAPPPPLSAPRPKNEVKRVAGEVEDYGYAIPQDYILESEIKKPETDYNYVQIFQKYKKNGISVSYVCVVVVKYYAGGDIDVYRVDCELTVDTWGSIDVITVPGGYSPVTKVILRLKNRGCIVRSYGKRDNRVYCTGTESCENDADYRENNWVKWKWQQDQQPRRTLSYSNPHPQSKPVSFKEGEVVMSGYKAPPGFHQVSTPRRHPLSEDGRYTHVLSKICKQANLVDRSTPDVPIYDFKQCFFVLDLEFNGAFLDTFQVKDNKEPEKAYDSIHVIPQRTSDFHKVFVNKVDRTCAVRTYMMGRGRYVLDREIRCEEDEEYKRNYLK